MNRREALKLAQKILFENKIDDAPLEAEVLLRHTLQIDRARLFAEYDAVLTEQQETAFQENITRRTKGIPTSYITGEREFYGLRFYVDENVLIPRPETELLVEKAIELTDRYASPVIVDVGTGCGNIAISLAVNLPHTRIYATDSSVKALDVARRNAGRHNVTTGIQFFSGDLLEPIKNQVDIIVANLPYVKTEDLPSVNTNGYEPRLALNGGENGLDIVRRLCEQVSDKLKPGGTLLLEIGLRQKDSLVSCLSLLFPDARIEITRDLAGIERVVSLTRR
jgi:release factor glutamine methyltransferase